MYTETELETIGIITEKAKEKAWELGYEGANDLEDAFECIMWRLEYLETVKGLREAAKLLGDFRSLIPETEQERESVNRDIDRTLSQMDYLDKRLAEHCEHEPTHMRGVV